MAFTPINCPDCNSLNIVKYGKQPNGEQRYICHNPACTRRVFLLNYRNQQKKSPPKKEVSRTQIIEMALNGVDISETARQLGVSEQAVGEVFQLLSRFQAPPARVRKRKPPRLRALAG
ncbi:MAG: IS1 family transposase [Magnetococcales bacterium]|nr:IS1 family transposase [Magnetococcales bacterium]